MAPQDNPALSASESSTRTGAQMSRRQFTEAVAMAGAGLGLAWPLGAAETTATGGRKIKLGLDNCAVRAIEWKAAQLVDYAASIKCDSVFISDVVPCQSFEEA